MRKAHEQVFVGPVDLQRRDRTQWVFLKKGTGAGPKTRSQSPF